MSLGLGSNKSMNRQESTGSSYGYSNSQSQDFSQSSQNAVSGGQSTSAESIAFEDFYKRLFGGAENAATSALAQAPELATTARQLFTGGSRFLESLGNDAGSQYLEGRLNDNGALLDEQIANLRSDISTTFREELNPAITARAVAGGGLGGGRQGVAQGAAIDASLVAFARGSIALRVADQQSNDSIAAQVAGNSLSAANTGLGALPGLMDIQERGTNAELGTYASLASILGDPTTLSNSQATNFSESTAQSISEAIARSFGEQSSKNQSWGYGRSNAWDFSAALIGSG